MRDNILSKAIMGKSALAVFSLIAIFVLSPSTTHAQQSYTKVWEQTLFGSGIKSTFVLTKTNVEISGNGTYTHVCTIDVDNTISASNNWTFVQRFSGGGTDNLDITTLQPNARYFLTRTAISNTSSACQSAISQISGSDNNSSAYPNSPDNNGMIYFETDSDTVPTCYGVDIFQTAGIPNFQNCSTSVSFNNNSLTTEQGNELNTGVIINYEWPINELDLTPKGVRGKNLHTPNDTNTPTLQSTSTLTSIQLYLSCSSIGTCNSQAIQIFIDRNNSQNSMGCESQAITAGSLTTTPTLYTLNFTGTCQLIPTDEYDFWITFGGSGISSHSDINSSESGFVAFGSSQTSYAYNQDSTILYDKIANIISPIYNQTTSTSVPIEVNFLVPPSFDFIPSYNSRIEIIDALTNEVEFSYDLSFEANTVVSYTYEETIDLSDGSKIIEAYFEDENGFVISEIDSVFFNVNVNTYQQATGLSNPLESSAALTQNDCTTFDVGCQFQKAIIFLLKPTESSFRSLTQLQDNLKQRVPFSYYYEARDKIENIDNGSGSLSNYTVNVGPLGEITIINWAAAQTAFDGQYINTISTWISYAIWFAFIIWVYRRVLYLWSPQS